MTNEGTLRNISTVGLLPPFCFYRGPIVQVPDEHGASAAQTVAEGFLMCSCVVIVSSILGESVSRMIDITIMCITVMCSCSITISIIMFISSTFPQLRKVEGGREIVHSPSSH